jgi:hypothetical protein
MASPTGRIFNHNDTSAWAGMRSITCSTSGRSPSPTHAYMVRREAEDTMSFLESVQHGIERASEEAARLAKIQHLHSVANDLNAKSNQENHELVAKAMELFQGGKLAQTELASFCQQITTYQQQIAEVQEEIKKIQAEGQQPAAAPQVPAAGYPPYPAPPPGYPPYPYPYAYPPAPGAPVALAAPVPVPADVTAAPAAPASN